MLEEVQHDLEVGIRTRQEEQAEEGEDPAHRERIP